MNYYRNCCVDTCSNIHRPDSDIRFFGLPLDNQQLLCVWLKSIARDEISMVDRESIICSEHFKDDDYVLENGSYELSPTAFPSKLCHYNDSIESSIIAGPPIINIGENIVHQNRNNQVFVRNVDIQANNRCYLKNSNGIPFSKKSLKIIGYVKTPNSTDSLLNNTRITNDETVNNKYHDSILNSSNNPSTELDGDVYLVEKDVGDEDENNSINANLSNNNSFGQTSILKSAKNVLKIDSIPSAFDEPPWKPNTQMKFKIRSPNVFKRKIKSLKKKNNRLNSKVIALTRINQDLLGIQVKYMQLKQLVLETENKFILKGIDTSEYPLFCMTYNNEVFIPQDIQLDVSLECKLDELNNSQKYIANNSMTMSSELPTDDQPSTEN